MRNKLIHIILLFVVISCSPREKVPKEFPNEDEMAQILAELYVVESIITHGRSSVNDQMADDEIPGYYRKVLSEYDLSTEEFDTIRDWYAAHPYHFQKVYDKVIVLLSEREADLNRQIQAEEEKKDTTPVIRDLWDDERIMTVTPADTVNHRLPFKMQVDSITGGQIRLSAVYKFLREDLSREGKTLLIAQYADSTADTVSHDITKTFKNNPLTLQLNIDSVTPLVEISGFLFDHDTSFVPSVEFSNIRLEHLVRKNKIKSPEMKAIKPSPERHDLR
ncbi:MAG: hypothetical protein PWQ17_2321 [Anaerophaga sp.]|nr:hypothetical protein [Anaerophaga sp.]